MRIRPFCFMLMVLLLAACSSGNKTDKDKQPVDTMQMLIMQVQKCSRLYTVEYNIHKIVTHDDVVRLKGTFLQQAINVKMPIGDRKVAIPMDATLKAYIDFDGFSKANVIKNQGNITIILPDPKVVLTNTKIDQKNIKEYVSFMRSHFSDAEMADYEQQGRASIIQSIPQLDIVNKARENATRILVPMLKSMGYDEHHITITFRKDFDPDDVKGLIDNSTLKDERKD
jgi:hypothetical protein